MMERTTACFLLLLLLTGCSTSVEKREVLDEVVITERSNPRLQVVVTRAFGGGLPEIEGRIVWEATFEPVTRRTYRIVRIHHRNGLFRTVVVAEGASELPPRVTEEADRTREARTERWSACPQGVSASVRLIGEEIEDDARLELSRTTSSEHQGAFKIDLSPAREAVLENLDLLETLEITIRAADRDAWAVVSVARDDLVGVRWAIGTVRDR